MIYLLHFTPSYKHARHYLGYAEDVAPRVYAHLHGRGARLTEVAHDAGCQMTLVRVWEGTRRDERKLKNQSHVKRHCPICCGQPVQMPLLLGEAAYVPSHHETEAPASPYVISDDQLNFDDFNVELRGAELADYLDEQDRQWLAAQGIDPQAELDDLREGIADIDFWRSGY